MPTLATATRNASLNAITALLNNGTLVFTTSGDVEVATLTFGATAFATAADGVATANAITSDTSATGGTIAKYKLVSSGAATIISGNVTLTGGGGDFQAASLVISASQTVAVGSLTITMPAS